MPRKAKPSARASKTARPQPATVAALADACARGDLAVVGRLIRRNHALVNQRMTDNGATPLLVAAQKGHLAVVKFLVEEGKASVDQATNDDATPLFIAAQEGHLDVVKYLVEEGKANVNQSRISGATPLFIAAQNGHLCVVK
jgi:ankyrin repeat protein